MVEVADWVSAQNTLDAGYKWLDTLESYLLQLAVSQPQYAICKDPALAVFDYHCFTYNDKWLVAYKIINGKFIVYRFILGARLNY